VRHLSFFKLWGRVMQRRVIRNILKGVGVFGVLLYLTGAPGGYYLLGGSIVSLFLGGTDFGRQCPLLLTARHLAYRIRSKGKGAVITPERLGAKTLVERGDSVSS
jgi:hypothetical protein